MCLMMQAWSGLCVCLDAHVIHLLSKKIFYGISKIKKKLRYNKNYSSFSVYNPSAYLFQFQRVCRLDDIVLRVLSGVAMTRGLMGEKASRIATLIIIVCVLQSLNQYFVYYWLGCGHPLFAVDPSNESPLNASALAAVASPAVGSNVGTRANWPYAFPPCDLSGLRVLLIWVHFESNLGDEMETT